jgi:murein DD-endopeptidase MepM/ murein hydrolase activator NlpD
MIAPFSRREVLLTAAAAAFAPGAAFAAGATPGGLRFLGNAVQGGLVIGRCGTGNEAWVDGKPVRVQNGLFCFGFGRDAASPAIVKVRYPKDYEETREVLPRKRNFRTQKIDGLPEKYVSPPKEVLERIARDAKAVAEARSRNLGEMFFADSFVWPADGPISGVYGSQRILNGQPREPHYGLDIAAPEGAAIKAPVSGIVTLAEELYLSGNTMVIDHGHGVSTSYLHMSRQDVKVGDRVEKGEQLGLVGKTGRVTGPHLCWRMNWFQTRLDVALLVPPRPAGKT